MARDRVIRRMRKGYAALLCLYPRRYRERFAEQMEQTFADILREREKKGAGLSGFVLWILADTVAGAMKEHIMNLTKRQKSLARISLVTASLLTLPLIAMQFTDQVTWAAGDFFVAGALLFGAGLTYELIAARGSDIVYRVAVGLAVLAALLLIWTNFAVGLIGNESNPANLMYVAVLAVGIAGAMISRLRPAGMARVLFAMALTQAAIAMFVLVAGLDTRATAVLLMNGFFVSLFTGSALLFRITAKLTG